MAQSDKPRTLPEKVWSDHVIVTGAGAGAGREPDLIYIDLHLVHEVTSPQAFDGLRLAGRPVHRPDLTIATEDHRFVNVNPAQLEMLLVPLLQRRTVADRHDRGRRQAFSE